MVIKVLIDELIYTYDRCVWLTLPKFEINEASCREKPNFWWGKKSP